MDFRIIALHMFYPRPAETARIILPNGTGKRMIMNIPYRFLQNQTFDTRALAFNRQLTPNYTADPFAHVDKPLGTQVRSDGSVILRFYGPCAQKVTASHEDVSVELKKQEDGMWTGVLPYDEPGFKQLAFMVDGVKVINPLAPIGWGSGAAINYIEIPDEEQDFLLMRDVPHGTVSMEYFPSSVTGETECCYVYTPPGYRNELASDYPVLYLQHGGGENEGCWVHLGKVNMIMDNMLADGTCVPFIIVMNNVMLQVKKDGKWEEDVSQFGDMLIRDCIPFIEKHYRVRPGKKNRAIAGLSLGSLLSGQIVMERTDLFGAAGLFTGYTWPIMPGRPVKEQPWLEALNDAETFNREVNPFFGAIGDREVSLLLFENERVFCREKGVNYIQKIYPGTHEWRVWRAAAHDFFRMLFR